MGVALGEIRGCGGPKEVAAHCAGSDSSTCLLPLMDPPLIASFSRTPAHACHSIWEAGQAEVSLGSPWAIIPIRNKWEEAEGAPATLKLGLVMQGLWLAELLS